jgi:hypothetical protein
LRVSGGNKCIEFSPEFHRIQLLKSEADGEYIVGCIVSNPQMFHTEKKPGVVALFGFEAIDAAFNPVGMKELILLKWDKVKSPAKDLYAAKAEGLARMYLPKPTHSLKDKFISDLWPKYLSIMGWLQYLDPDRPIFLSARTGESLPRCNRIVIEHLHREASASVTLSCNRSPLLNGPSVSPRKYCSKSFLTRNRNRRSAGN